MELIILMVGLYAVLYLVILRPQQRRAREAKQLLQQIEVGDEVLTSAGIYGQITEFDGQAVFLAVSDNLEIKVTRESIAERVVYGDPNEQDTVSVSDDDEEK